MCNSTVSDKQSNNNQQKHLESADLHQGASGAHPESVSGVSIQTLKADDFPNLTGTSLFSYICGDFHEEPFNNFFNEKLPTDRQTDRQMPGINNLLGGDIH